MTEPNLHLSVEPLDPTIPTIYDADELILKVWGEKEIVMDIVNQIMNLSEEVIEASYGDQMGNVRDATDEVKRDFRKE